MLCQAEPGLSALKYAWWEQPALSTARKFGNLDAQKLGMGDVCAALVCSPSVQALGCAMASFFDSLCTTFAGLGAALKIRELAGISSSGRKNLPSLAALWVQSSARMFLGPC